jgi:hypothetical protein
MEELFQKQIKIPLPWWAGRERNNGNLTKSLHRELKNRVTVNDMMIGVSWI